MRASFGFQKIHVPELESQPGIIISDMYSHRFLYMRGTWKLLSVPLPWTNPQHNADVYIPEYTAHTLNHNAKPAPSPRQEILETPPAIISAQCNFRKSVVTTCISVLSEDYGSSKCTKLHSAEDEGSSLFECF